ncbi:MAG: hypothetical protein F4X13_11580 [Gammaproteobacteria bacterium]|nr:hypothetical protein [Gammaproteobacteria bacterium]
MTMIRARRHSTGFRFAGALVLLALVPSFAPDTWGLSCLHHASHDVTGEHESPDAHPHHPAAPEHERGHDAAAETDHRGGDHHHGRAIAAHAGDDFDHGPGHHDPEAPPCTCAGECPTSTGPSAPVHAGVSGLVPDWPQPVRWSRAIGAPATNRTPYLLPFANAPPLS